MKQRAAAAAHVRCDCFITRFPGRAQHESFDPKPDAPDNIRGEFAPIRTRIPGVLLSEHLPKLAERIDKWAMVRSLKHPSNDHWLGHEIAGGRIEVPLGFGDDSHRVLHRHELLASVLHIALCAADRRQDERVLTSDEM